MANLLSALRNIQARGALSVWFFLGLTGSLAGCASQSPYASPQATGALNSTAQILGDLAFLFR